MPLKTSHELTNDTIDLINKFKSGKVKPIPTGKKHRDDALLGGLLPGTVLGLVARSGHGKTYDAEEIQGEVLKDPDVIFVNCNWEMSHFKLLVRAISRGSGQNVKQVLFDPITTETGAKFDEICKEHKTERVLYQNEPVTAEVFNEDIEEVIKKYPTKKIVVSIDNLENILNSKGGQKDSMDFLLSKINRLKNIHWYICFIVLNQMNQNYLLRMDDIKKQRPIDSDVYGSDQLYKLCDVLYIKIIPWKLGIREKFMVFSKSMYEWLDEFKIPSDSGKTASFDPYGTAYYFYLKLREPEDERNIRDIFAERMFTRETAKFAVEPPKKGVSSSGPNFTEEEEKNIVNSMEKIEKDVPPPANFNMTAAFGGPSSGSPSPEDEHDDMPF